MHNNIIVHTAIIYLANGVCVTTKASTSKSALFIHMDKLRVCDGKCFQV